MHMSCEARSSRTLAAFAKPRRSFSFAPGLTNKPSVFKPVVSSNENIPFLCRRAALVQLVLCGKHECGRGFARRLHRRMEMALAAVSRIGGNRKTGARS